MKNTPSININDGKTLRDSTIHVDMQDNLITRPRYISTESIRFENNKRERKKCTLRVHSL